ncbi:hypothetical protein BN946_scf185033.g44 [Trametes cinnabarina]|uniref:Uncharacterized protein n=1 Tax=Pycnoporus cinnabarinus TaxID=5643 RepID=A0A060SQQ1_PYCCI|nr:hypothetical protein BN946_scf185033.g44 [Trametes cinnabarina]
MTSPHSFSFSKPAMQGDAVSVLVLVEDSAQMAAKWPDVRDSYLPILLENLRTADHSVQMEARWLTTSSSSPVATHSIMDAAQCRSIPALVLGQGNSTKISPAVIHQAISILASASKGTNATRHFILVAATGLPSSNQMSEATPSGFDPWDDIALVLKQEYIRLHVILNIGAEMRTYHELFKRSLQLQSNSEVPAWFPVDSRKFSIRLSGRPQYVRSSGIAQGNYGNPSPPSLKSASPMTPPMQEPSPPASSPPHRKTTVSPTSPRSRPRAPENPGSPPDGSGGSGGLVSYLQQMHGLTKKKSYGVKAPKKTYADAHLHTSGRPILPRLEVSQSDIYTYPSFERAHGPDTQVLVSDPQPQPNRRHSADQLPPSSLVARTSNEDRRARRRGPWLPIAPLVSSTPSSPTSVTSPGTLAALQSLASMTPRLPDFVAKGRAPPVPMMSPTDSQDPHSAAQEAQAYAYSVAASHPPIDMASPYPAPHPMDPQSAAPPPYYYSRGPESAPQWAQQAPVTGPPASPTTAPSPSQTSASSYSDASRQFSDYAYGSSPPSSSSTSPPNMASLAQPPADNPEDQPFIITRQWLADADAQMAEAVRSGAIQANMSPALCSSVQSTPPTVPSQTYLPPEPIRQEPLYYTSLPSVQGHSLPPQESAYSSIYGDNIPMDAKFSALQTDGAWQYEMEQGYGSPIPDYVAQQGHWYPS